MIKYITLIILILMNFGCSQKKNDILASIQPGIGKNTLNFKHKRVKELFIVIFEKNYLAQEWKEIFDLTNVLSVNKKVLRMIEGDVSDSAGTTRASIIQKNANILSYLSEKSIFMLSWSAQDENCKVLQNDQITFTCKPRNTSNPLNGGLPNVLNPLLWMIPDPVKSDIKIPYLKMQLEKISSPENVSSFFLELRLREENFNDDESLFKGDVIPSVGSHFLKPDGSLTNEFFQFGYVELTLGN